MPQINFENLSIAAMALYIIWNLTAKLIDAFKNKKDDNLGRLCDQILSFTSTNQLLVEVLTKTLTSFEKDQKELITNINQLINLVMSVNVSVARVDERTELCNKNKVV